MIGGVLRALREADYAAEVAEHAANLVHVKLSGYPLPSTTCVEATADIILPLPITFPRAAPYGFFALTPITKRTGDWANATYNTAPFPSSRFFSRKCPTWHETKHGILTYLGYVNAWLEPRA